MQLVNHVPGQLINLFDPGRAGVWPQDRQMHIRIDGFDGVQRRDTDQRIAQRDAHTVDNTEPLDLTKVERKGP